MQKRILAILLSLAMCLSLMTVSVSAAGETVSGKYYISGQQATIELSLDNFTDGNYTANIINPDNSVNTLQPVPTKTLTGVSPYTFEFINVPFDLTANDLSEYSIVIKDNKGNTIATGSFADTSDFSVVFDVDGGTPLIPSQSVAVGSAIVKPSNPSKTGFNFDGWYIKGTQTAADFTAQLTGTPETITLIAKWVPSVTNYVVTFDSQGGTAISSVSVPAGGLVTRPADPTKAGYTFYGWVEASGNVSWNFASDTVNRNMTLQALWSLNTINIPTGSGAGGYGYVGGGTGIGTTTTPTTVFLNPDETPAGAVKTFRFEDVFESDWFYENVYFVYDRDLFKGTSETLFSPQMNMTRAMYVTVLGRTAELLGRITDGFPRASFKDVADGTWYTKYVDWAVGNDIVKGYDADTFGPDDSITREQMAVMFVKFMAYMEIEPKTDNVKEFTDAASISTWAVDSVNKATAGSLLNGYPDGTFKPQGTATRAEVATIFTNFIKAYTDK